MKLVFLKWWLVFILIVTGSYMSYQTGIVQEIYLADDSFLSNLIYILFGYGTLFCGLKSWSACRSKRDVDKIRHDLEKGWFLSELSLTLGMLGTVWGFIIMFRGDNMTDLDVSNSATMMQLIASVATGMSTALYTTLVGLSASALLKMQCFNVEYSLIDHAKPSDPPEPEKVITEEKKDEPASESNEKVDNEK